MPWASPSTATASRGAWRRPLSRRCRGLSPRSRGRRAPPRTPLASWLPSARSWPDWASRGRLSPPKRRVPFRRT
eukprot:14764798-Alexandrium_andersonii.AAC.1